MIIHTHKQGFISLFTALLATVILAISVGMSSIALKQIVLTSTADDANEAFYSADAGLQCAIMLDLGGTFQVGAGSQVSCGSIENISIEDNDSGVFIFNQNNQSGFNWMNGNCVRIIVRKGTPITEIESFGYNVSCEEIQQSPRTVERALRVRYGS